MSSPLRVSIVGGSGYGGGEVLRLLLDHPGVTVSQITSRQQAGNFVYSAHPNLRGRTTLQFTTPDQLEPCDVLFLCMPHGEASGQIERFTSLAHRVIDLSADFRLRDSAQYQRWYDAPHPQPAWLDRFVYGLPELRRTQLTGARLASGVGCNATAINLALLPLAKAGLIKSVVADLKVGSSEAGFLASAKAISANLSPADRKPFNAVSVKRSVLHRHEVAEPIRGLPLLFGRQGGVGLVRAEGAKLQHARLPGVETCEEFASARHAPTPASRYRSMNLSNSTRSNRSRRLLSPL